MKRLPLVSIALVALLGSMLPLHAVESETLSGTAARTGTYKRPLLVVDGKRYELKASDKADASVAESLAKFSTGDTNSYAVVGTRGTVNGNDGILVDRITPVAKPLPSAGAPTPGTKAVQGNAPPAPAQTTPTVTSSVVTVGSDRYLITSPGNCWPTVPPLDAGASAPIIVDATKFPNWKTMAFYDGARRLAEITQGPTQFTATKLTPGYHVFSVLATDGQGTVRTADPKMVVVREPATEAPPAQR